MAGTIKHNLLKRKAPNVEAASVNANQTEAKLLEAIPPSVRMRVFKLTTGVPA